jgi:hypothetical protein
MSSIYQIITQPEHLDHLADPIIHDIFHHFKYGDITYFRYIIEYYMNSAEIDDSLYNFIRNIITDYNEPNFLNRNTVKFLKYLDTKKLDIWFVDNFMFHLMLNYYSFKNKGIGLYKKVINKGFKKWCDRWYELYRRNTVISRVTRNIIQPCQERFLNKLYNPHTELGYKFGEKQRDELPWDN